uniref:Uncharacterized protein n=1 Tax=Eutreptiella gymnastica TaxID=73025 RepID=A0A7S1I115_9EUGL
MTVGTPKPRALSPVVRQSPTLPPPVAQSPKMLMMRDTPQGKRKKALPASVKKLEGPRDQKNLLQWKHRGLQLLNYHEQFVSLHSTATTAEWKASSTALSRMNRHEWIQWANKAHGEILYQFKKQAERWIQESKYRLRHKNRQANKRFCNTPRRTPSKKPRDAYHQPQDHLQYNARDGPLEKGGTIDAAGTCQ